tara:strand:+ start:386 stop:607 length:222 start_codon:yes stop_codon:yes gene_type:complete
MIKMEDGDSVLIEREDYHELISHLVDTQLFEWDLEIEGPPFLCKRRGDEMCKLEFSKVGDQIQQIQLTFHETK